MPRAQLEAFSEELRKHAASLGRNPAGAAAHGNAMRKFPSSQPAAGSTPSISQAIKATSPASLPPPNISA